MQSYSRNKWVRQFWDTLYIYLFELFIVAMFIPKSQGRNPFPMRLSALRERITSSGIRSNIHLKNSPAPGGGYTLRITKKSLMSTHTKVRLVLVKFNVFLLEKYGMSGTGKVTEFRGIYWWNFDRFFDTHPSKILQVWRILRLSMSIWPKTSMIL